MEVRRQWKKFFKFKQESNSQPRKLHPVKISFKSGGEIKTISDTQKLGGI